MKCSRVDFEDLSVLSEFQQKIFIYLESIDFREHFKFNFIEKEWSVQEYISIHLLDIWKYLYIWNL